jgi:hypothetical protein
MLRLTFEKTPLDVFVEGKVNHYFGKPHFTQNSATLSVSGTKSLDELKCSTVRITLDTGIQPVEQQLVVT